MAKGTPTLARVFSSGEGTGGFPHHGFVTLHESLVPPQEIPENDGENNSLLLKIPPLVNLLWKILTLLAITPHRIPNESDVKVALIVMNLRRFLTIVRAGVAKIS